MRKIALVFALSIILLLPALAVAQTNYYAVIKTPDTMYAGEKTNLILTILNNDFETSFDISVKGSPSEWIVPEKNVIKIPANSVSNLTLALSIPKDANPGTYEYTVSVNRVVDNSVVQKTFKLSVLQNYQVMIKEFDLSCKQCKGYVSVSGIIRNMNNVPTDYSLRLSVNDNKINVPIGTINVSGAYNFNKNISLEGYKPGNYILKAEVLNSKGTAMFVASKNFSIQQIKYITYDEKVTSNPFGRTVTMSATNLGNSQDTAEFSYDISKKWYSSYSGQAPTRIENNIYYWSVSVKKGSTSYVSYTETYWPMILLVVLIVIGAIYLYYISTSPLIKKIIVKRYNIKKGTETSVSVHVRNGLYKAEGVVVRDIIPQHFSLTGTFETIKPLVRKVEEGTEMIWRLGNLRPREERVLHYKMKANVDLLKSVQMKPAVLRFRHGIRSVRRSSNPITLHGTHDKDEGKSVFVKVAE